jgi:heptose I phosphotransferase
MTVEAADRFHAKQGRTVGRWTLTSRDGATLVVYLKRHYQLPRRAGLLALVFPRRAWSPGLQEWNHLRLASRLGLPVPRPVAAGELLRPGARLQSFLAVEELTGMLAAHEAIPLARRSLTSAQFRAWKAGLAVEMARLARLLHDRGYFHKDLYLCHFYLRESDCAAIPARWNGRVVVIDLHRLARHRVGGIWWKIKDIAQLLYSSEIPGVRDSDRMTFWRAYQGERRQRLLGWLIRMKWRLYRRHNRKKAGLAPKGTS